MSQLSDHFRARKVSVEPIRGSDAKHGSLNKRTEPDTFTSPASVAHVGAGLSGVCGPQHEAGGSANCEGDDITRKLSQEETPTKANVDRSADRGTFGSPSKRKAVSRSLGFGSANGGGGPAAEVAAVRDESAAMDSYLDESLCEDDLIRCADEAEQSFILSQRESNVVGSGHVSQLDESLCEDDLIRCADEAEQSFILSQRRGDDKPSAEQQTDMPSAAAADVTDAVSASVAVPVNDSEGSIHYLDTEDDSQCLRDAEAVLSQPQTILRLSQRANNDVTIPINELGLDMEGNTHQSFQRLSFDKKLAAIHEKQNGSMTWDAAIDIAHNAESAITASQRFDGRDAEQSDNVETPSFGHDDNHGCNATVSVDAHGHLFASVGKPNIKDSNRASRRFGATRFLILTAGDTINSGAIGEGGGKRSAAPPSSSCVQRLRDGFRFLGRTYRFLFFKSQEFPLRMVFLAEFGPDLEPVKVQDFYDWHFGLTAGKTLGIAIGKANSRIQLAFTTTTPTIVTGRDTDVPTIVDDIMAGDIAVTASRVGVMNGGMTMLDWDHDSIDSGDVDINDRIMTDGVIWAGVEAFQKVCDAHDRCRRELGKRQYGIYSAFQVRIGSAKGMLSPKCTIPPLAIHIHKSCVKYDLSFESSADDQRTIEVASTTSPLDNVRSAVINEQVARVLLGLGLPAEMFRQLRAEHSEKVIHSLLDSEESLLSSTVVSRYVSSSQCKASWEGNAVAMLHAGLELTCPMVKEAAIQLATRTLQSDLPKQQASTGAGKSFKAQSGSKATEKLRIVVDKSIASVRILPDPFGSLAPGQAFYCNPMAGVLQGSSGMVLGTALLGRSPFYKLSDLQKFEFVDPGPLYHTPSMRGVLLLSIQGPVRPAALFAGSDYDGDKAEIFFDPRIVEGVVSESPFNNASKCALRLVDSEGWIEKDCGALAPVNTCAERCGSVSQALFALCRQSIERGGCTGILTNLFANKVDAHGFTTRVRALAHLSSVSLDCPKQGLVINPELPERQSFANLGGNADTFNRAHAANNLPRMVTDLATVDRTLIDQVSDEVFSNKPRCKDGDIVRYAVSRLNSRACAERNEKYTRMATSWKQREKDINCRFYDSLNKLKDPKSSLSEKRDAEEQEAGAAKARMALDKEVKEAFGVGADTPLCFDASFDQRHFAAVCYDIFTTSNDYGHDHRRTTQTRILRECLVGAICDLKSHIVASKQGKQAPKLKV